MLPCFMSKVVGMFKVRGCEIFMSKMKTLANVEYLIWSRVPKSAFVTLVTSLVTGLIPAALSARVAVIIQEVKGGQNRSVIVKALVFLGCFYILQTVLQASYSVANNAGIFETINLSLRADLCKHKCMFPLIRFEEVDFLDALRNAETSIENEELPMVHYTLMNNIQAVTSLVSVAILLYSYHPYLCLLALLSTLPVWVNRWIRGSAFNRVRTKTAEEERKANMIKGWFYEAPHAKELRVNQAYDAMQSRWAEKDALKRQHEKDFLIKDYRQFAWCSLLKTLGVLLSILLSLSMAQKGMIPASEAAAAMLAFSSLQVAATDFFTTLGNGKYYLERSAGLLAFFDEDRALDQRTPECRDSDDPVADDQPAILLEHVDFTYPESGVQALQDVSFRLAAGERVAVVGMNGSGKTTLAKILLKLYTPDHGAVRYTGQLNPKIAYVPQEIPRLKISVRAYLSLGEPTPPSDQAMLGALDTLGLDMGPAGLDTELGREFSGIELSGGQWQRLALAKATLGRPDLFVFDEATGAIDPLHESYVLQKMLDITEGKTSVIITHRLAICPHVEKILVLDEGKVAAYGSHDELIQNASLYKKMYASQSSAYTLR